MMEVGDENTWFTECLQFESKSQRVKLNGRYVTVVFNGSKILIWKQITTELYNESVLIRCFQWFKDTNLKANHNLPYAGLMALQVVFNGSKILIWKQITTKYSDCQAYFGCFQWFKDTNLKANHNAFFKYPLRALVVFNGSKILIWKQITTMASALDSPLELFSMVQRY